METEKNKATEKEPIDSVSRKEELAVKLPNLSEEKKHIENSKKDPSTSSLSNESTSDDITSQESSIIVRNDYKKGSSVSNKFLYPLRHSLFANVPPYLNFTLSAGRMRKLPKEISNTLRWKASGITSPLITKIVRRSGFTFTDEDSLWLSMWRRQMKCQRFREMEENQKINHFPGTFHLGHKDKLWLNIVRMQELNGKEDFSFMPLTFILPQDIVELREAWVKAGSRTRWIVKPPSSARGDGISIIHRWEDVPETKPVIVQRYITHPYLINHTKFDLRLYVLVTSFDPLRLYIFEDGLVRFATEKYSKSLVNLSKHFIHLTNYNVNRSNSSYTDNENANLPEGHKWSLKCLWSYFRQNGVDDRKVWLSLIDVVVKTMICCEDPINKLVKTHAKNRYSCYELFGFDLILDYTLKPWLLEVNITPSLQTSSQLDMKIKSELVRDMLNIVGFHIPKECELDSMIDTKALKRNGINQHVNISWNKVLYDFKLSYEERIKQFKFRTGISNHLTILKDLNPDDVRHLIQSEDELARCGQFIRIFPSKTSFLYLKFFENIKYYNLLLAAWERKYQGKRKLGIVCLQSYCERGYHLQSTDDAGCDDKSIKPNDTQQKSSNVKVETTLHRNNHTHTTPGEDLKIKKINSNDPGTLLPVIA